MGTGLVGTCQSSPRYRKKKWLRRIKIAQILIIVQIDQYHAWLLNRTMGASRDASKLNSHFCRASPAREYNKIYTYNFVERQRQKKRKLA